MWTMKVLVAEDDKHTREGLVEILGDEGFETLVAADGEQAVALFRAERPDFICLDIMMPGLSGYDVCRAIRDEDRQVPIIFISAKSEEIDKVVGLELGADDFIVKPFGVKEVIARIRAVARRCLALRFPEEQSPASFWMDDLQVFPAELRARRKDGVIDLSLREVRLLQLFYENQGRVLDRDFLFDRVWGMNYLPNSRTLDQHISKLRKRIERDPKRPSIIRTVHGAGYRYQGP
jgi:DNA-binding response OmpR family regulator